MVSRLGSAALVLLVRVYQWTLRPFIGPHCRFEPSCSHYAIQALDTHGPLRGTLLATGRVLRCNPWSTGGDDPVPPPESRPATLSCRCHPKAMTP